MSKYRKVQCFECENSFYLLGEDTPVGIKAEEAFPVKCPFCDELEYVSLLQEEAVVS
ncbi:MAG: hypothetical protein WCV56_01185 [Candidatus Omnitrophota bacterium]